MEIRIQYRFLGWLVWSLLLSLLLSHVLPGRVAMAEPVQVIKPDIERRVITEGSIDAEDFEAGFYYGALSVEDFGVSSVVGIRFAYHVNEDLFVEAVYGQSDTEKTSWEQLQKPAQLLSDDERQYSYYNVSLGYNLLPGEAFMGSRWAFNTSVYWIGGVGSTEFAGDERFTVNLGVGYRLLAMDWLAWHIDMRDHLFDIDVIGKEKTANNLEFHTGLTFFF